ncbi:MAG: F0F1 ATP synthase subunit B [Chloroflexota bacterium]
MPVSLSVPTLVLELVIFVATVVLMERLVFDPIRHAWTERDRRIQEGLSSSNESREEAEHARQEVHRILQEARQHAQSTINRAVVEGGNTRDELVTQATAEFGHLLERAREQIAAERERSADALLGRIVDMALLAATHVTGQRYDQAQVRELAATVVEQEGLR